MPSTNSPAAADDAANAPDEKVSFSTRIRRRYKNELAGALRDLDGEDGAPHTQEEMLDLALQLLFERLRRDYNGGQPFRPARRVYTRGRPPGSA